MKNFLIIIINYNMSTLQKSINIKKNLEKNLYEIISKYIYKYIKYIYSKDLENFKDNKYKFHKHFQKKLLEIAKWTSYIIDKEYSKFLKWCDKKYNLNENDLQTLFNTIITSSIKIILNKSNVYIKSLLEDYSFTTIKKFYFKALKKISRYFYENPKNINISNDILIDQIDILINSLIPIKKIIDIIEYSSDNNSDKYFKQNESQNISIKDNLSINESLNKSNDQISLKYFSSNNSYNDLKKFKSNISKSNNSDNVKYIQISKKNTPQQQQDQNLIKNKLTINDFNENFFND